MPDGSEGRRVFLYLKESQWMAATATYESDESGQKKKVLTFWGTVTRQRRFLPGERYEQASLEERESLVFPEDWIFVTDPEEKAELEEGTYQKKSKPVKKPRVGSGTLSRRGRPRKNPLSSKEPAFEETNASLSEEGVSEPEERKPPLQDSKGLASLGTLRRRGRPRKNPLPLKESVEEKATPSPPEEGAREPEEKKPLPQEEKAPALEEKKDSLKEQGDSEPEGKKSLSLGGWVEWTPGQTEARRRGRPRKDPAVEEGAPLPEKRKRGRPRKNPIE